MSERTATDNEWSASISATHETAQAAVRAVQQAIDARVRELMLESRYHGEAGNQRASRAAAARARFVGRTSARAIVAGAIDAGIWRRFFGLR